MSYAWPILRPSTGSSSSISKRLAGRTPPIAPSVPQNITLAAGNPGARVLRGDDATVDRVVAAVAGADLVHVAAHGRFRSDGPLFSSFRLADGALTIDEPTPDKLEHAIRRVLGDPALAADLGRRALARSRDLRLDATARGTLEVMRRVAAG